MKTTQTINCCAKGTKIHLFLVFFLIFSCVSQNHKKKANLEANLRKSLNQLTQEPDNPKFRKNLEKEIPVFFREEKKIIDELKLSNEEKKWENIAAKYEKLNQIFLTAIALDSNLIGGLDSFETELLEAKAQAVKFRLKEAEKNFADTSRKSAILAIENLKKASEFDQIAADTLKQKLQLAYEKALICMAFEFSNKKIEEKYLLDLLQNKIFELVKFYNNEPFIHIITDQNKCKPKFYIKLSAEKYEIVKEVNKVQKIDVADSVQISDVGDPKKVYQLFYAEVSKFSNHLQLKTTFLLQIYDAKGKLVSQKKMSSSQTYSTFWARFRGDKRALNDELNELCGRAADVLPNENILIEKATDEVFFIFKEHLRLFLKGI